uniref:EOG090X032C n=1 Tax=Daphnia sinensis TaxID=1820382 RepID=A0A4Y7NCM3_9CRUS|nr:EOG090X032C [Daphnia sinensis]
MKKRLKRKWKNKKQKRLKRKKLPTHLKSTKDVKSLYQDKPAVAASSSSSGKLVLNQGGGSAFIMMNLLEKMTAVSRGRNNPGAGPPQPHRGESFFAIAKSLIVRALIIYFITSMFRRPSVPVEKSGGIPLSAKTASTQIYANGTAFDLCVYVSEDPKQPDFNDPSQHVWTLPNLMYGDWYSGPESNGIFTQELEIPVPELVQNNGSFYLHTFLVRTGDSPDPSGVNGPYRADYTVHRTRKMNRLKKRKYGKTHNLLTGTTVATEEEIIKAETIKEEILSHWHPNLTINIIFDYTAWTKGSIPSPIDQFIEFSNNGEFYKPILYFNDYWNLVKDYQPFNTSVKTIPLRLTWQPLSMIKWQVYAAQSMKNQWAQGGPLGSLLYGEVNDEVMDEEQDSLKEAMLDTNPYLLGMTFVVSVVHSIFEFLAFKNDIQFWRQRESLEGLSVRSVFFNVFQSLIVLLYVLDNETNMMIRISCFIGLGIEVWKIHKVVDVKIDRANPVWGFFPVRFADKSSYVHSHTKEYDALAFKYLSWALYPLLIGYAIYSLVYEEHKGWYSWVLSMLYGFLLTFGFIMMTPQLFINYKLKSVAHLPWRMMTYKALNTFIDDIFAFVIKMPTLYRIGCLRDDIIFFIFLYQRWIYRVDPSRLNEYGVSQEMLEVHQQNGSVNAIEPVLAAEADEASATVKSPKEKKTE